MTDKQRAVLAKYLSGDAIEILNNKGFDTVTEFISFIFATTTRNGVTTFDICERVVLADSERKCVTENVNANRKKYSGPEDEHYSIDYCFRVVGSENKYYCLSQSWFKGMGNSRITNWITLSEDLEQVSHDTSYTELVRMGIYSMTSFFEYLKVNKFNGKNV